MLLKSYRQCAARTTSGLRKSVPHLRLLSRREKCSVVSSAADVENATAAPAPAPAPEPEVQTVAEEKEAEVYEEPLPRARALLADGKFDQAVFEEALDDLEFQNLQLKQQAEAARSQSEATSQSLTATKEQIIRLNADFDNYRRRMADEKQALTDAARGSMMLQLLPLIDNFELARMQVKTETEGEVKINNSYQGLYRQMVEIMRQVGVEALTTEGQPFDPEVHEAIMQEPSDDVPDGTVLMEFRKGFKLNGKLLRPAMVKVSVKDGQGPVASSEE